MPSRNGTPIYEGAPGYVAAAAPFNWLDLAQNEAAGLQQSSVMRGQPVPLAWWQMRKIRGPGTIPQPVPVYYTSRPFSRGADGHAPRFGQVSYNPIGAGIYAPYRLPSIAGPGARYQHGAIFFDVQSIPVGMRINPSVPIETVNALIAQSHASAAYTTTG